MNIKIVKANKIDANDLLRLIHELAEFEKLSSPDVNAGKRLVKDAFGERPLFYVLMSKIDGIAIGYAFYFFTYSSFLARKTLYLEDIFISQQYRNLGAGKLLFDELVNIARKNKCGRMEWCVLNWNKNAIRFYKKLGAKKMKEWKYYRLSL